MTSFYSVGTLEKGSDAGQCLVTPRDALVFAANDAERIAVSIQIQAVLGVPWA